MDITGIAKSYHTGIQKNGKAIIQEGLEAVRFPPGENCRICQRGCGAECLYGK